MSKEFYSPKRRQRNVDFLYGVRVARMFFLKRYDLQQGDFELLCDLHAIGRFRRQDFENGTVTLAWDKGRWKRLMDAGFIIVFRERNQKKEMNYKIYKISRSAHDMIEKYYRILLGEEEIPESRRHNPIMREETYTDKRYAAAIKAFNAARSKIK